MNRLVVHHIYANGMACDLSGYRNHGVPYSVSQAAAPNAPAFAYNVGDSRVIVEPSQSLQDLIAVRALVTFYLNPAGGLTRRYNLVEGHLSFALFVNPDASISGTIVDATGNWTGVQSGPGVVSLGRWHQAEIRHDGVNQTTIFLDGMSIGSSYTAAGPVRSVGAHGIAIGHWPEVSGQYTFSGFIREIWVYKYDPAVAAKSLLDPCCGKYRGALDETAETMRGMGYTAEKARAQGMDLIKFGLSISAQVRGNDPTRSQQHTILSAVALAAFKQGDSAAYTSALTQLAQMSLTSLSPAEWSQIRAQEEQLVKGLPPPIKQWQSLIEKICWGRAKLDPQALLNGLKQPVQGNPQGQPADTSKKKGN
jgi:hypothetical protein